MKPMINRLLISSISSLLLFSSITLGGTKRPDAVSLSGKWQFCKADPLTDIVADRTGSFDPPQLSPDIMEVIPDHVRNHPDLAIAENAEWGPLIVPAAWEQFTHIDFNGTGWYRREVEIPDEWTKESTRVWIEFDAVATVAGVWLNGQWLGGNVGDLMRWRVEATEAIREGSNRLLIHVDELPGHITQGFLSAVAPHHGGIWQEVRMYRTGPLAIETDGVHIQTRPSEGNVKAVIVVEGNLAARQITPKLRISQYVPQAALQLKPELIPVRGSYHTEIDPQNQQVTINLQLDDINLWSPENPFLYLAEVILSNSEQNDNPEFSDRVYQTFGFRTIEIKDHQVLLNGEEINLRSVLNWGYYPRVVSPYPPPQVVREEFAYIKSLGFNAETICLMNMPDYFYDIADEMGLFVWQEYPTWHNDFTAKHLPTYRRMFPAFFRRDRNHPAIILRTISVEAGVENQEVMAEIVHMAERMTDTPVQDNSSWLWMSNVELTDWYGEDNYWNNDRWAQHMLIDLPAKLDELPTKPYMIGETIAASVWIDTDTLQKVSQDTQLSGYLLGVDDPHKGKKYPYWFPACYQSCVEIEKSLRNRYNQYLPDGVDIVRDYLLPQSQEYARQFRQFQTRLLYADPRYAGYTVFIIRDLPDIRSGLLDDFGRGRWSPEDWQWFGKNMFSPVTVSELADKNKEQPLDKLAPELLQWDPDWEISPDRETPLRYLKTGYTDLSQLFADWPHAQEIKESQLNEWLGKNETKILTTSALLDNMIPYMENGGIVFLITNRWPGGLGSQNNMYWADAFFTPPVGPFSKTDGERILKLHQYDLTHQKSEVIPVEKLNIAEQVDPMLRLFEMHNKADIVIHDQLFATRVGQGLLIASALDHTATAGQWVLGKVLKWAHQWKAASDQIFPVTSMPSTKLSEFAVPRVNTIKTINDNWLFKIDPQEKGEALGWMKPKFDDSNWDVVQADMLWESQGYRYDGMAWYRRSIDVKEEWGDRKIILVAEGVDDAYNLWINGKLVAHYGSFTEHAKTVYRTKTETDITEYLAPDKPNLLALQVVDVFGGGGISRPIYLRIE